MSELLETLLALCLGLGTGYWWPEISSAIWRAWRWLLRV